MAVKAQAFKLAISHQNNIIGRLCSQINQQLTILETIKAALPNELAGHALHCVCNNKKLILYTDSANWASQLRFHGDKLLAAAAHCTSASTLQVKIVAADHDKKPKRKALIPSQTVADGILQQSQFSSDPNLKQALGRLGATLSRIRARG